MFSPRPKVFTLQKSRVGLLHDNDARVTTQLPRKLPVPDIHGKNFGRAALQQTVREAAGGRAEVQGGEAGHSELKMLERVFELVAAAADKFLRRVHGDVVGGLDAVTGFFSGMAVDANGTGEDEALGLFAAVAEGALDEGLIQTGHIRTGSRW